MSLRTAALTSFLLLAAVSASSAEVVRLAVGESLPVSTGEFTIEFVATVSDQRCPVGVDCVWEGDAEALIRIASDGTDSEFHLHTFADFGSEVHYRGHSIAVVRLVPHPIVDVVTDPQSYILSLEIRKNAVPTLSCSWSAMKAHFR